MGNVTPIVECALEYVNKVLRNNTNQNRNQSKKSQSKKNQVKIKATLI